MHAALDVHDLRGGELGQRAESGFDLTAVAAELTGLGGPAGVDDATAARLLDELEDTTRRPDWPYDEPDDLAAVRTAADWPKSEPATVPLDDAYAATVQRAWTGRVAGNTL